MGRLTDGAEAVDGMMQSWVASVPQRYIGEVMDKEVAIATFPPFHPELLNLYRAPSGSTSDLKEMRGNEEPSDDVLWLYCWERVKARFWSHFEGGLVRYRRSQIMWPHYGPHLNPSRSLQLRLSQREIL